MSDATLKIVSLNIEGDKHLDTVTSFLALEHADVVCLQEVYEKDLAVLKEVAGQHSLFVPFTEKQEEHDRPLPWGMAVFSPDPLREIETVHYFGTETSLPTFQEERIAETINRALLVIEIKKEGVPFTIGTTHFTWTPDGQADDRQRNDLEKLFAALEKYPEIVLCGDMNAPRGRETWERIAKRYVDNIPPYIESTLDPIYHRAPSLRYVVDGLFSTCGYTVSDVAIRHGLSDHCAIVGHVSMKK